MGPDPQNQPSNQNKPSEGMLGAVTAVADKLSPLCLAAVLLAGIYGYLTYTSLREEREEFHERQLKLIEMIDACFPKEHEDRRNE